MPYKILILDDDADFNSLLTDIFEQADYEVASLTDPNQAIESFRDTDFDVVVTDHKMPDMSGAEFLSRIKEIKPAVPVIMVSGFLENDTIRELISEGVDGVFLKPLNIFSLLERSTEVIEEARKVATSSQDADPGEPEEEGDSGLDFPFHAFACKSGLTRGFAERLHGLRSFKTTLSLIGEPGTHFRQICEDIRDFSPSGSEHFVFLTPSSFDSQRVLEAAQSAADAGGERLTCVLLDLEQMNDEQKLLAGSLTKRSGSLEPAALPLRAIFCLNGDLDNLFDEGLIDENLYILMGTAEVKVPPLRDCGPDLPLMAQQLLVQLAQDRGQSSTPRLEKSARDLIRSHKWEGNFEELERTLRHLVDSSASDTITATAVKEALKGATSASPRAEMETYLARYQEELVRATAMLLGEEKTKVASFYGTDDLNAVAAKLK